MPIPSAGTKAVRRVTRRRFLKGAGVTLAAGAASALPAPFISRAFAETKKLTILQWSHFIPEFDTWFDKFAKGWGAKNGLAVEVDHIPHLEIPARAAAEVAAKAGHDLFMWNGAGGPHVYKKFLVNVNDLMDYIQKKHGKVSKIGSQIAFNEDTKTWSAYPDYYIANTGIYFKSMWDEIGMKPDTWDDVRIGGAKLKKKGHPVGIALSHCTDANLRLRGAMWCYGASVQDETGTRVTVDSKGTVEAVKFFRALYKEAMTPEVLSWDDASDNRYIDSGRGSYIMDPISPFRTAQKENPKLADDMFFWPPPKGPVTRLTAGAPNAYGIWNFAKNKEAAIDFLKYYTDHWVEAFKASTGYNVPLFENMVPKPWPILGDDPTAHPRDKLKVFQTSDEWTVAFGYPGPAWGATDEVVDDYLIPDMFAKAATDSMTPEDAVKWGQHEVELIFKKWKTV